LRVDLVVDFDSTFVSVESLDELAKIVLDGSDQREAKVKEIEAITAAGMEGRIGFGESLSRRLKLVSPDPKDLDKLIQLLRHRVTPSVAENQEAIREMADNLYIISGGFKEFILPIVTEFGITPDHVLANTFSRDREGRVIGCDTTNPLSGDNGKVTALRALGLIGRVVMVGDGYSDYHTREAGVADEFVAFVENVSRAAATEHADTVARSFGEVLEFCYSVKA